jgi:hypothetical protein
VPDSPIPNDGDLPPTGGLPGPPPTPGAAKPALGIGLIGATKEGLSAEAAAGVTTKVVRVSWKDAEPGKRAFSESYMTAKAREIEAIRSAGMSVTLDLGLQDSPQWIHEEPDSYLVNQYGERWTASTDGDEPIDKSDANLIFNQDLRRFAEEYIERVTGVLGPQAAAIRVGGGRWNELGFPVARTSAHPNTYWAFDRRAQASSPVPGWRPGDPSPRGEARDFLGWYLGALVDYQQWQIETVRRGFADEIVLLLPSWGMRPGDDRAAVGTNLSGSTSAEINGEVQRGYDFARQVGAITDPGVALETTWLDAPFGDDESADPAAWSPAHFLASLSGASALAPPVWGENTGNGGPAQLATSFARARRYGLAGVVWFRGEELGTAGRASLADLRAQTATG